MSLPNLSILECCKSLEVYHNASRGRASRRMTRRGYSEYTNIYGFYIQQNNKTNERNWYKNDARSIWWDGKDDWYIGDTNSLGKTSGYAELKKYGSCLPKISDTNWKLYDGKSWNHAAKNDLKVRCGFRTTGRCA